MKAADVQALFVEAIAWPTGVRDFLARSDDETRNRFAAVFAGGRHLDAVSCMEIYANAYFYRIRDALAEVFPLVRHLLGAEAFHDLVTDYLWMAPPRRPDLSRAGDRLPAFLHAFARCRRDPPYVPAFARCEWAELEALVAPDASPARPDDLAGRSATNLLGTCLSWHPSVRMFKSGWDYRAAATALARGEAVVPVARPGWDLLVRPHHAVHVHRLPEDAGWVLLRARTGATFAELAAAAAERGLSQAHFASWLRTWLEAGALCVASP